MSLIYITGCAGSGKSTIKRELINRGHEAYDEDDPNIGSAHNKATNEAVEVPPVEQRSPTWFSEHEWRVYPESLRELRSLGDDHLVFLCGNVATEQQLQEFFDKVVFLNIDEKIIRSRLAAREDNDFGKSEAEIQMILSRNKVFRELFSKIECDFIDASKPLDAVLSKILALSNKK